MGKQRVEALKRANEDEDKTIRKLEKLLRIDKTKSEKSVPRMFNDGLDYALEMCLPENIGKMYTAAKESAEANEQSDSEWQEDFALATTGKPLKKRTETETKLSVEREKKARERLRKVESKYFDVSGDEIDSDLSEVDSEFENNANESSDEAPDEMSTKSNKSKRAQAKRKQRAPVELAEDEESDEDDDEDGLDDLLNEEDSGEEDVAMSDQDSEQESDDSNGDPEEEASLDDGDDFDNENADMDEDEVPKKPDVWEDIYGRKRDADGNIIAEEDNKEVKYVPPHIRARLAAASNADEDPKRKEHLIRLKKLMKGNLNRLSEANMHKIVNDIDQLYMRNPHHDINSTLATLLQDALIGKAITPERMIMEHAMLIAALHANVGSEVGTHMLEMLIERFNSMMKTGIDQYEVEDKTLDNIVLILCHMYTFKVSSLFPIDRKLYSFT